jgi:phage tail tape-measure protein
VKTQIMAHFWVLFLAWGKRYWGVQEQRSRRPCLCARKRRRAPMAAKASSGRAGLYRALRQAHRHQGRSTYGKVRS